MSRRNRVESLPDLEVEAEGPLHVHGLDAGDRYAEGGGDPVDDVLQGVEITNGCAERRTSKLVSLRLAEGDVDVIDAVGVEEFEDKLAAVESVISGSTVGENSNPNRNTTEDKIPTTVCGGLFPTEARKIYGRELDTFLVEDLDCLRTRENVSPTGYYALSKTRTSVRIVGHSFS